MRTKVWLLLMFCIVRMCDAAAPPNIVLFVADDLGATDLGCFGSTFYETPNLDQLAATGTKFTAAYSTCPVCSPSRSSIMTGRYPARTRITDYISASNTPEKWTRNTPLLPAPYEHQLADSERTIAEALREAGYTTFFAGKWHLGGTGSLPTEHGFDINKGGTNAGSPRNYFSPYGNPHLKDGPLGEHLPIRLANEASQFIAANAERPFFMYLPSYSVHIPLQAPPELIKKYEAKAAKAKITGPTEGRDHGHKVRLVQNHPTYAAMVESMDTAVGIVLDRIKSLGLEKNTIVVFTSDNGGLATAEGRPTANVPLRAGKGWLYEGGIRVPTIVRWPGVLPAGGTNDRPITGCDWFPTFLIAAGTPGDHAHDLDGRVITDKTKEIRPLFWHYPHYGNQGGRPGGAIREGKWKLIEWYEGDEIELYDLENDPSETTNLAKQEAAVAKKLKAKLVEWREAAGAKMPSVNPRWRAGQNEKTPGRAGG